MVTPFELSIPIASILPCWLATLECTATQSRKDKLIKSHSLL